MPKLCEAIAILKGVKGRSYALITAHDKLCQKPALFNGMTKTYEPLNEDDPDRPDGDMSLVQQRTDAIIADMLALTAEVFDTTATQEYGNTGAKADLVVDGVELATDVPATYLLFLEKQLNDLHTAVGRMPTLSAEHTWAWDTARNFYVSEQTRKVRTKKTPRVVMTTTTKTTGHDGSVTEQQQGQIVQEDLPVGYWHTVYFSSALEPYDQRKLLDRIVKLRNAVKQARERANTTVVAPVQVGKTLLDWVFSG